MTPPFYQTPDPRVHSSFRRAQRLAERLQPRTAPENHRPVLQATNIHYEISDKTQGFVHGGLPAIHKLALHLGLPQAIDRRLHLFKIHNPYHESDHVLNLAYNPLCQGTCLQDIQDRREDEPFLTALDAQRLPAPSTAGDFCRRFTEEHIWALHDAFDEVRVQLWKRQEPAFFEQAIVDVDGTFADTDGECKQGADFSYKNKFSYHPLIASLANTKEVLVLINRSGNRPSYERAAEAIDRSLNVCFQGGFARVLLRGDTDFSQTQHLDRWDEDERVQFVFGYKAYPNLVRRAENLPADRWQELVPEQPPAPRTGPREKPEKVKRQRIAEHGYRHLVTVRQQVASFEYRPVACSRSYRMVVVKKYIDVYQHGQCVDQEIRYLFYITNDRTSSAAQIVALAHGRCNQENLLAQLHGCRSLHARVDSLVSNWAYMVMTTLGWNLKSWWGLQLPVAEGPEKEVQQEQKRRVLVCEFRTFVEAFVHLAAQVIRQGGRIVIRLLGWNRHQEVFLRFLTSLNG